MAHRPDSLVIRSRVNEATQDQLKSIFLNILEKVHAVRVACKLADINPTTAYRWRKEDQEFADAWDNAIALSSEMLEAGVYQKLATLYTDQRRKVSMPEARLTEFMLSGMMPDKYAKSRFNIEIDNRQLNVTIDWSSLPDEIVTKFNANEITLQDVYEYIALQSKQSEGSTTSEDRRSERSG